MGRTIQKMTVASTATATLAASCWDERQRGTNAGAMKSAGRMPPKALAAPESSKEVYEARRSTKVAAQHTGVSCCVQCFCHQQERCNIPIAPCSYVPSTTTRLVCITHGAQLTAIPQVAMNMQSFQQSLRTRHWYAWHGAHSECMVYRARTRTKEHEHGREIAPLEKLLLELVRIGPHPERHEGSHVHHPPHDAPPRHWRNAQHQPTAVATDQRRQHRPGHPEEHNHEDHAQ